LQPLLQLLRLLLRCTGLLGCCSGSFVLLVQQLLLDAGELGSKLACLSHAQAAGRVGQHKSGV
jgi:hypothetical protein